MKNTSKLRSNAPAEAKGRNQLLKFGRNESCPCGSGKKFKHCCEARLATLFPPGGAAANSQVNVPALMQSATQHHNAGLLHEAERLYKQILQVQPHHPDALHLIGLLAAQTGRLEEAIVLASAAIALHPAAPDYFNTLAAALIAKGRFERAEALLRHALILDPGHVHTRYNLGNIQQQRGRMAEALAYYEQVVKVAPAAGVYNNMANCHLAVGQLEEAVACARHALSLDASFAPAWINLGAALQDSKRLCQAVEAYNKALEINNLYAPTWLNLAGALKDLGRVPEALDGYRRAVALAPDFMLNWQSYLLTLNYAAGTRPHAIYQAHQEFAQRFESPLNALLKPHVNDPVPERRLKVGYVSGDFRKHAVTYFLEPVLANHDSARFEVFLYSNNLMEDAVTVRLKGLAPHWLNITNLSDEAAAERIRQDGVDILVDLAGHSAGNRVLLFARKPAPVQVNWLGYLCTTGLRAMDYRISDNWADPPGMTEDQYTERLLRLPDAFVCYAPAAAPPTGSLPALSAGYVTFASFNNLAKLTDEVIALWSRVLQAVPGARLLLKAGGLSEACGRERVVEAFASHGIPEARLELVAWDASYEEHIARFSQADIALDTFPCNGGTTSFDSLWMGLPVISLAGDRFLSRMGVSMLNNLELQELIAADTDEYVQIAASLARDLGRLAALRAGLRARMAGSPLTNAVRFTRHLEEAYRTIWRTWCSGSQEGCS